MYIDDLPTLEALLHQRGGMHRNVGQQQAVLLEEPPQGRLRKVPLTDEVLRLVMIAEDQPLLAGEARHVGIQPPHLVLSEQHVPKVVDLVASLDDGVPVGDQSLVHLLDGEERADRHPIVLKLEDLGVVEVGVAD